MPIRVAVIEDHPLMLKAVVQELDGQDDIKVVGTADHGSELLRLARETCPDVIILDLGMASGTFEPASAVKTLREACPKVEVLVLTGYEDATWVRELIAAGAQGYVLKSDDLSLCLPEGVRKVHTGGRFYSPAATEKYFSHAGDDLLEDQELALLNLAAQGLSNARIGQELKLSAKTVRNYFTSIYAKLGIEMKEGLHSRVAAINKARELGLLHEES
jgi:DNA-binding NarL/FixJ family response regulator